MASSLFCPGYPGDLLIFQRPGYKHYAVNVGNGYIVHVTSEDATSAGVVGASTGVCCSSNFDLAVIKKERYRDFKNPEDQVFVEKTWKEKTALQRSEIIHRALSRIGETGYNLLFRNCEHFARWCRYGEDKSDQAENVGIGLGIAGLFIVGALAIGGAAAYARNSEKEEEKRRS
jgi:hypothetical protein